MNGRKKCAQTAAHEPRSPTQGQSQTAVIALVRAPRSIDVVRIDVEGFEKNVLLGLQQTLAKYRPSVLMEFSPSTQESFAGIDEFRSLLPDDYEIATVNPHNKVLGIFSSPSYKLIDFDFDHPGSGLNILLRPRGN